MTNINWNLAPTHDKYEVVWLEEVGGRAGWYLHLPEGTKGNTSQERYEDLRDVYSDGRRSFWSVDGDKCDREYYSVYHNPLRKFKKTGNLEESYKEMLDTLRAILGDPEVVNVYKCHVDEGDITRWANVLEEK